MKSRAVKVAREGGVAHFPGLSKGVEVDLSAWPDQAVGELEELFCEMPARPAGGDGADKQVFRCTFRRAGREQTVYVDPQALGGEQADLFHRLLEAWRAKLGI